MNINANILNWYKINKRDLPWRHTRDAYAILVSEMMLQQTRVETVVEYYRKFVQRFPDVVTLSRASEQDVLECWKGLGYYNRARNLYRTAKQVVEQYNGTFPTTYDEIIALPGIGPYIAGAVLSIAYDMPYPAVDGNVLRVISRLDGITQDIMLTSVRKIVEQRVRDMMPRQLAGDFTQALMELGSLVCKPGSPDCASCPICAQCSAFRLGKVDTIPYKKPKVKPRVVPLFAVVVLSRGAILMEHRKDETLLAKMWGVPVIQKPRQEIETYMQQKYGIQLTEGKNIGHVVHVFSHQRWEMDVIVYQLPNQLAADGLEWVELEQLDTMAVPTAFTKVLSVIKKERCE